MFFTYLKRMPAVVGSCLLLISLAVSVSGQRKPPIVTSAVVGPTNSPVVKQLDLAGLKKALTPSGKPLFVNFWATWCDPCRDEFPDLVKLDAEYRGKIDLITISLDDLVEIDRDVPKFLSQMKAEMPAYLLKAEDDDAAIALISKNYTGGLPFSILYSADGKEAYFRQGKIVPATVRSEIDKLLNAASSKP